MPTAPTFVGEHESTWNVGGGTPKTATWSPASGNILVVGAVSEDATTTLAISGGPTWTLQQSHTVASNTTAYMWTATAAGGSITVTITPGGSNGNGLFGFNALEFSASDGVGASNKAQASGAPTVSVTTQQSNSAVVVVNGDWNAADGTTRTWRTVNVTPTVGNGMEVTYFRDAAAYVSYMAYYSDAGTAAANNYGLSAPTGQKYSLIAVEIKGAAGGATPIPAEPLVAPWPSLAAQQMSRW